MRNSTILPLLTFLGVGLGVLIGIAAELDACTRIFWNTNPDLMIVGRNEDYVTASRVSGAGVWRLMFIAILPNCMAPLIVQASLGFSNAILDAAALGFIGLGAQPPSPEWGSL